MADSDSMTTPNGLSIIIHDPYLAWDRLHKHTFHFRLLLIYPVEIKTNPRADPTSYISALPLAPCCVVRVAYIRLARTVNCRIVVIVHFSISANSAVVFLSLFVIEKWNPDFTKD